MLLKGQCFFRVGFQKGRIKMHTSPPRTRVWSCRSKLAISLLKLNIISWPRFLLPKSKSMCSRMHGSPQYIWLCMPLHNWPSVIFLHQIRIPEFDILPLRILLTHYALIVSHHLEKLAVANRNVSLTKRAVVFWIIGLRWRPNFSARPLHSAFLHKRQLFAEQKARATRPHSRILNEVFACSETWERQGTKDTELVIAIYRLFWKDCDYGKKRGRVLASHSTKTCRPRCASLSTWHPTQRRISLQHRPAKLSRFLYLRYWGLSSMAPIISFNWGPQRWSCRLGAHSCIMPSCSLLKTR